MRDPKNLYYEVYLRLGALHHAGVCDYKESTKYFSTKMSEIGAPSPYNVIRGDEDKYISQVQEAYQQTLTRATEGRQLSLFEEFNLESIIQKYRVKPEEKESYYLK